jgi:Fe-S-cluster containining protein
MNAFECKLCGECCYGKGGIKVTDIEVIKISNYLKISPEEFRSQYCEARNSELILVTGRDGFCIFFDPAKQCLIHNVKPEICRLWPFYEANINDEYTWRMAMEACPGINSNVTFEEFVKQGKK